MLRHTGWAPGSNTRNSGLGQATLSSGSCTQRVRENGQTLLQCQRIKDQQSTSIHLDKMSDGLFYSQRMNVIPPSPCLKPFNVLPGPSGKRPNSMARPSTISSPNQRLQLLCFLTLSTAGLMELSTSRPSHKSPWSSIPSPLYLANSYSP